MNEYEYKARTSEGVVWAQRYEAIPAKMDCIATYHCIAYERVDFYVDDEVVFSVEDVEEVWMVRGSQVGRFGW